MAVYYTTGYEAASSYSMTHARILWNKLSGTVSATSELTGYAATLADNINTATWWESSESASWQILYSGARTVDSVGIGAHNLSGKTVTIEALIDSVWTTVASHTPIDNSAILSLFAAVSCTGIKISVSAACRIGVVYTGVSLEMIRPGYASLGPLSLARSSVITSYISEGGQLLERFIERRGLTTSLTWNNIPENWYRVYFDPFAIGARTEPFFIALRPYGYADDCAYCWVNEDIIPQRSGTRNLLTVGFSVMGHQYAA